MHIILNDPIFVSQYYVLFIAFFICSLYHSQVLQHIKHMGGLDINDLYDYLHSIDISSQLVSG